MKEEINYVPLLRTLPPHPQIKQTRLSGTNSKWRLLINFTVDHTHAPFLRWPKKGKKEGWNIPCICQNGNFPRDSGTGGATPCIPPYAPRPAVAPGAGTIRRNGLPTLTEGQASAGDIIWAVSSRRGVKSLWSLEILKLLFKETKKQARRRKATPNLASAKTSHLKSDTKRTRAVRELVCGLA